jgi:hypothetical protein
MRYPADLRAMCVAWLMPLPLPEASVDTRLVNEPPAAIPANGVWVTLALGGGWDVRIIDDTGIITVHHCSDWHHVERTRRRAEAARHQRVVARLAATLLLALLMFPVAAAAQATNAGPADGIFAEPRIIDQAMQISGRHAGGGGEEKNGLYPELSNMVTGAGWISGGPGYRQWLWGDRAIVDASTAVSWRLYKMAQARFELTNLVRSRLALGTQARWQDLTQVTYFGEGEAAAESDRSEYRLRSTDVVGYAIVRPSPRLSIGARAGWLQQPTLDAPAGTFKRANPYTREVFPNDPVFARIDQPGYLHGDAYVEADTRDHRGHATRGGLYRGSWSRYSDRAAGTFSFDRYEAEGAQFVPLADSRVVLAVHGWLVGSGTGPDRLVPFYLLPSLGGANTLRGYANYRFHDRNLALVNAEARVALFTHVDAAAFLDAGNVAAQFKDLNLDKRSIGIGLRLHSDRATLARLDVAHGAEGWRALLRTTDPLRLSRLARRTAALPFVP